MENKRITPKCVWTLEDNEVFVFGLHAAGAVHTAHAHFDAVMGQGVGILGRSYAIPTMQGGVETICPYVDEFVAYARQHPELHFLVTAIGCSIAGFEPEDIASMFEKASEMQNISLPESFWEVIRG